jgi:hypothetical protein
MTGRPGQAVPKVVLDCLIASLLAMTVFVSHCEPLAKSQAKRPQTSRMGHVCAISGLAVKFIFSFSNRLLAQLGEVCRAHNLSLEIPKSGNTIKENEKTSNHKNKNHKPLWNLIAQKTCQISNIYQIYASCYLSTG